MLLEGFKEFASDEGLDLTGRSLVGISGGVDSIVLADLASRVASEVVCLHVNYGLRGTESDSDERFVREFCRVRELELVVVDASEEMKRPAGTSMQALARAVRYREFVRAAEKRGIDTVLLAHHADDQVETVLMSLFRGAGVHGISGMPVSRPAGDGNVVVIRPLLFARRKEIEEYARTQGLRWREDSSNTDPKFRRSVLRSEIIPLIEKHFGEAVPTNILRSASLARRTVDASRDAASVLPMMDAERKVLFISELESLPAVSRTRVILDALRQFMPHAPRTQAVAEEIDSLVSLQPGRRVQLGESYVLRERQELLFVEAAGSPPQMVLSRQSLELGGGVRIPGGVVLAHQVAARPGDLDPGTRDVAFVDGDRLSGRLTVSAWEDGDRISLLGTAGTKKVSDLLTEEKVPSNHRRLVPVVRSEDNVVWVAGFRLSAEFAVRDSTSTVVMLAFVRDPDS